VLATIYYLYRICCKPLNSIVT